MNDSYLIMQQQKIYFEKQSLRRCGLHAVNNLLQKPVYDHDKFQQIGKELSKQSQSSHSTMYFGNYDFNIIERALLDEHKYLQWHKGEEVKIEDLKQENVYGILLNITKEQSIAEKVFNWEPKHWIAINKLDNETFIYLDSRSENYIVFKTEDLAKNLSEKLKDKVKKSYVIWVFNIDKQ